MDHGSGPMSRHPSQEVTPAAMLSAILSEARTASGTRRAPAVPAPAGTAGSRRSPRGRPRRRWLRGRPRRVLRAAASDRSLGIDARVVERLGRPSMLLDHLSHSSAMSSGACSWSSRIGPGVRRAARSRSALGRELGRARPGGPSPPRSTPPCRTRSPSLRQAVTQASSRTASAVSHPASAARSSLARRAPSRRASGSGPSGEQLPRRAGQHVARRGTEDPADVGGGAPCAPYPGASSGPLMSRSSPVSPIVAPTTAPNEPSGSAPSLSAAQAVEHPAGDGAAVGARWRAAPRGPSVLDVSASTNTPAPWRRAVSKSGSSEPNPRYGLAVIASAASGDAGSR